MILWCDGPHEASENMRRDAGLLEAMERGAWPGGAEPAEPVLRLFGFVPPGITLGHSQRAEHELDLARCRADGVTWARRPTGGRAIFHSEEWTYSLAAPIADPDWGGTLGESYARVSRLILASLVRLGVPAEIGGQSRRPGRRNGQPHPHASRPRRVTRSCSTAGSSWAAPSGAPPAGCSSKAACCSVRGT